MKKILIVLILAILITSCDNEPISEANINTDTIEVDSSLYLLMERIADEPAENAINCIDFNYPFALFIFDEQMQYLDVISITSDHQFSVFLGSLNENYSISLSYPISGTLNNGDLIEINSNEELKEAIDACVRLEDKALCDNNIVDCTWKVSALSGHPTDYEGDYFKVSTNGIIQFHRANNIYFGTWVSFFIGNDLHLNMNFNASGDIGSQWNHDWKVVGLGVDQMELQFGIHNILIKKDCVIPCATGIYQVCEFENNPGFASFELQEYSICHLIPVNHDGASALELSYFETEDDAQNNTNEISASAYVNTTNPQTIYVRLEDLETGNLIGISSFEIEAIACD